MRPIEQSGPPKKVSEFLWIGPRKNLERSRKVQVHKLAVEDALNPRQMAKVEVCDDQLFVVGKTAHIEGDRIA